MQQIGEVKLTERINLIDHIAQIEQMESVEMVESIKHVKKVVLKIQWTTDYK